MMNFTERAVPGISANFLMQEAASRYKFAKKYLSKGATVLDMACGTGYGTNILSKSAKLALGIDINDEALKFANKSYANENTSFVNMDVTKTIFRDKSFDAVVAFEMIEHLTLANSFLKETKRILKQKGVFIVSTPNKLIQSPNGEPMSPYHVKEYSPSELNSILRKHFREVHLFGQTKNSKASEAVDHFMRSQNYRQLLVNLDVFKLRRLITKEAKEKAWRKIGNLAGRGVQEKVKATDFVFKQGNLEKSEYIIAVCHA